MRRNRRARRGSGLVWPMASLCEHQELPPSSGGSRGGASWNGRLTAPLVCQGCIAQPAAMISLPKWDPAGARIAG